MNRLYEKFGLWNVTGWLFASPGLLLLVCVMGFPLVYALVLSVSSFTMVSPTILPFTGLDNFRRLSADPLFWNSVYITLIYTVSTVTAQFVIGLSVALMLNRVSRGKAFYFTVLAVPLAMSPVSVGLIWRMLLQPNLGIVNTTLRNLGFEGVDWLGDPAYALWTIAFIDVWQQVSFVALVLTAGLAALPKEPYEAAAIDGANVVQQFLYITLPMLRPVASIVLIIQTINEIKTYDLVYVLTRGGPGVSTELLSYFSYKVAFLGLAVNEGSASSTVLLLMSLVASVIFFMTISKRA